MGFLSYSNRFYDRYHYPLNLKTSQAKIEGLVFGNRRASPWYSLYVCKDGITDIEKDRIPAHMFGTTSTYVRMKPLG